ncbi:MAG: type II toxin-antitoxin system HicA family toxin [Gammaproteobacteria bacterium]|nr:type II toxin-antitoxin system HicA family toxin [Gammaproteobacteria bacterium]
MAKLRAFSGKELCQLLQRHGFVEVRRKGSHVIMQKPLPGSTIRASIALNSSELQQL